MPRRRAARTDSPVCTPESLRPLPHHPDIQYERKRAKRLLADARRGDGPALAAMTPVAGGTQPATFTLSLAQLAVAREYGFASWPKLAAYYEMWGRHERSEMRQPQGASHCERQVRQLTNGHDRHIAVYGQQLATFLPRLYGRTDNEVFASPITEDEARFVVAREHGCRTWDELIARASEYDRAVAERRTGEPEGASDHVAPTPRREAWAAVRSNDLPRLQQIVAAHPGVVDPHGVDSLLWDALLHELRVRTPESRAITDWLATRGGDFQAVLDRAMRWSPGRSGDDSLDYLLARGGNPNGVAPNGISVIEFALVACNVSHSDPEAVDALARHVHPKPKAFWVAAGLGDLPATLRYLDRRGRPTAAARKRRPDWAAMGFPAMPLNPDAPYAVVIWEAALIAAMNGRTHIISAFIDRGFAPDTSPYDWTLLHASVGFAAYPVVRLLLERGADPDAPQLSNRSPRWLAANLNASPMTDARVRIRDLLANWPAIAAS